MKFDVQGNLYCTVYGQKDITILNQDGVVLKRMETTGKFPTNLAFGYGNMRKIFITEVEYHQIEVMDVPSAGLPLFK